MTSVWDIMFGKEISKESANRMHQLSPKRSIFAERPVVRKRTSDGKWIFSCQIESIWPLFERETGIPLVSGPHGKYCFLDGRNREIAQAWQEARKDFVFLRDCMDLSLALSLNGTMANGRFSHTRIGDLEYRAKQQRSVPPRHDLVRLLGHAISVLAPLKGASLLCAVPSDASKSFHLPKLLAQELAGWKGLEDISSNIHFENKNAELKKLPFSAKWDALENSQLKISKQLSGESVIIVDDKYQSGATMQYIGSELLKAGASNVFGLCCVKTLRDDDNQ